MNIADLIVEQLISTGVQHVFGVGGANIEDLFAAIQRRRPQIRAVLAKHEHGAASAAATYAKIRGGLGVVIATSGGGAMNLVHGLAEARASHIPLLAIAGEPPSDVQGRGAFQDTSGRDAVDALAVLGAAAGFALRIAQPEDALHALDRALAHIAAEAGPAVLLIAKDHQAAQLGSRGERETIVPAPKVPQPSFLRAFATARQLAQGRVLVIAGEEVLRARAHSELAQLVAALDARVAVTPDARDAFDNGDARFIGVAGAMGNERVASELQNADTCLLVGTRLPLLARMGLESRLLQMSSASLGRAAPYVTGRAHEHLECELRSGLRLLLAGLREHRRTSAPVTPAIPAPSPAIPAGPGLDSASVFALLQRAIAEDHSVLVDAGNTGASATHHLRAPRDGRWLLAMGMAGMGYSFGAAVGAAYATGKRCWVIAGDGAFYMHGLEIHTAIEHALPITYVIFDNRAHGMCLVRERLLLKSDGEYNSFRSAHLGAGLRAMFPGLPARECSNLMQLQEALEGSRALAGPSVIVLQLEHIEVPPFVALQRADPSAKTVSRGGSNASS